MYNTILKRKVNSIVISDKTSAINNLANCATFSKPCHTPKTVIKNTTDTNKSKYDSYQNNQYEEIHRGVYAWPQRTHSQFLTFTSTQKVMTPASEKLFESYAGHPVVVSHLIDINTQKSLVGIREFGSFYRDKNNKILNEDTGVQIP